jgi:hypothetical protein
MEVHLHSLLNLDSTSLFTPPSLFCCTYWLDHCMGPHSRFGFFGEGKIFYPSRPLNILTCNEISWRSPVTTAATEKQQRVRFVLLSHTSLSTIKNTDSCTTMLLRRINAPCKSEMYLGLHVNFQIFLSNFKQICRFQTDLHLSPQYKISRKPVQWKPC